MIYHGTTVPLEIFFLPNWNILEFSRIFVHITFFPVKPGVH